MTPKSLFDKLWERHVVVEETDDSPAVLFIDLHLIHEVTSPQAFAVLKDRGLKVRRPDLTLGTLDHSTPTLPANENGELPYATAEAKAQVETLIANCAEHNVELLAMGDPRRGIVHVIGPELGATPTGQDHCLRRQSYIDSRRLWRTRFRDWHYGGRPCVGVPVRFATQA